MLSQRLNKNLYTITKRTFLKYGEEYVKLYPKVVGKVGLIFKHKSMLCSYDKFTAKKDLIDISLSKYECDMDFITESMKNNKPIYALIQTDIVGSPRKGRIIDPRYLKKIKTDKLIFDPIMYIGLN